MTRSECLSFTLNGKPARASGASHRMLLSALRHQLGLSDAWYGCGEGHCGACVVLLDGEPVLACATPLEDARHREVWTHIPTRPARTKRAHAG